MLLIYQLALRGATVAVIDSKGDAESLVEYLSRQGRKARVLPLNSAAPGLLDRSRSAWTCPRSGPWPPRRYGCSCRG